MAVREGAIGTRDAKHAAVLKWQTRDARIALVFYPRLVDWIRRARRRRASIRETTIAPVRVDVEHIGIDVTSHLAAAREDLACCENQRGDGEERPNHGPTTDVYMPP